MYTKLTRIRDLFGEITYVYENMKVTYVDYDYTLS